MKLETIRILTRLRSRQLSRQKNKGLIGIIVAIAYFWLLELVLFFMGGMLANRWSLTA